MGGRRNAVYAQMLTLIVAATALRAPPPQMGVVSRVMGQFRSKRQVEGLAPMISKGATLPVVDAVIKGGRPAELSALLGKAKGSALLIGMPGAFTPTCSSCHMPSLVEAAPRLAELGVDTIAVLTSNDHYVNEAWRATIEKGMRTKVELMMLSDTDGTAVKALGLADDMGFGMSVRSMRFALLAEKGVVKHVASDQGMKDLNRASVDAVMASLMVKTLQFAEAEADVVLRSAGGFEWGGTF